MKTFFYLLTVLSTVNLGSVFVQPSRVNVDGNWYTNGQTAYVECGKSSVFIFVDIITDGNSILGAEATASPNFSVSGTDSDIQKKIDLDPNKQNGYIDVGYVNGSGTIRVYINQKPPAPTFTATSSLCSPGNSATFSVSDSYSFQGTKPLNLVWQTTGGVTVNGGTTYTTNNATTSSVTVQYNSFGSVSVRGVIPGCGNLQGDAVTYWFGTPGGSDITFVRSGGPDVTALCSGNYYNFVSTPQLPLSQYSYSWSIPQGSSNVNYFYSSGHNANIGAGPAGGGFILQMSVTNSSCNTTGGSSRTFYINSCGSFRATPNPATDKMTVVFDKDTDSQYVPDVLRLYSEKNQSVKEVKVKGQYSDQAVKDGLNIEIDVRNFPRGTYYLQGIYNSEKSESVRVILQ